MGRWTAAGVLPSLAVAAICVCCAPARAGLYLLSEPATAPTNNTQLFLSVLGDLRGLQNPDNPLRKRYLGRIAELEAKERHGNLTTEDRVNLSGYYLRCAGPGDQVRFERAVAVLEPAAADPRQANFMVLCNLATANELAGRLERAISYAEMALRKWPSIWPGLRRNDLYWFGRAEKYHLDLLKARHVEATRQASRGGTPEHPDALFPRVTFDAKAPYHIGELDAAQMIEIPSDGLLIVQQLLLWSPNDLRLQWLYAELLNALGGPENIMAAYSILDRLAFQEKYTNKTILAHRQALMEASKAVIALNQVLTSDRDPNAWVQLLWFAQPRGATLEPGAAALVSESGWSARAVLARRMRSASAPAPVEKAPAQETPRAGGKWLPDPRQVIVSFVAGVLVTLLGVLQVKEFRRRHQTAPAAPKGEA